MVPPKEYAKVFRETQIVSNNYMQIADNWMEQEMEKMKDKCYRDTINSTAFVDCVFREQRTFSKKKEEFEMIQKFLLQRFEHCAKKDDANQIYPCLLKFKKELVPYTKEFNMNFSDE